MSEAYQSKRERRQRMLDALPASLREHISLRNVEAVAALSEQAQMRLLEDIQAGLTRVPRALEQLRADPEASIADLLDPPHQLRQSYRSNPTCRTGWKVRKYDDVISTLYLHLSKSPHCQYKESHCIDR